MRQLLPIFVLMTALTTAACAQDSSPNRRNLAPRITIWLRWIRGRAEIFVRDSVLFGNGTRVTHRPAGNPVGWRSSASFYLNAASALEAATDSAATPQKYTIGKQLYPLFRPTFLRSRQLRLQVGENAPFTAFSRGRRRAGPLHSWKLRTGTTASGSGFYRTVLVISGLR